MGIARIILVRLVALLIIAAGWQGIKTYDFERRYFQQISLTIPSATPQDLDALYVEALKLGFPMDRMEREKKGVLVVALESTSYSNIENAERQFKDIMAPALATRKLSISGTSRDGMATMPDRVKAIRNGFVFSTATTIFGIAMLILSLRIFGGGRPPESPLENGQTAH